MAQVLQQFDKLRVVGRCILNPNTSKNTQTRDQILRINQISYFIYIVLIILKVELVIQYSDTERPTLRLDRLATKILSVPLEGVSFTI